MHSMRKWIIGATATLVVLASTTPVAQAGKARTDEELITALQSPKISVVTDALYDWQKSGSTNTNVLHVVKELLRDSRSDVRRKAARVLGEVHAPVTEADVAAICAMLKAEDPWEVQEALKGLRRLKAPTAVPALLEVLKSSNDNNVRDACRTLAVLGNKDAIPALEPLTNHPEEAVRADANKAIAALRQKP